MLVVAYILMGCVFTDILQWWMKKENIMDKKARFGFLEKWCYRIVWPIFPFVVIMYILYKKK